MTSLKMWLTRRAWNSPFVDRCFRISANSSRIARARVLASSALLAALVEGTSCESGDWAGSGSSTRARLGLLPDAEPVTVVSSLALRFTLFVTLLASSNCLAQ